jgi:anti-sigma B factor antagonist
MPEQPAKLLTYEIEREDDTAVIKCHGRLVIGTTDAFYQEIKDVVSGSKVVTLDLHEVTYVDSTGLGTLVRLYIHARGAHCDLKLLHLGKQLRNLLRLTNLLGVIATAEDHGISIG